MVSTSKLAPRATSADLSASTLGVSQRSISFLLKLSDERQPALKESFAISLLDKAGAELAVLTLVPKIGERFSLLEKARLQKFSEQCGSSGDAYATFAAAEKLSSELGLKAQCIYPKSAHGVLRTDYSDLAELPFRGAFQQLEQSKLVDPIKAIDPHTGLRTAVCLADKVALAEIDQLVPGEKRLFFIDANHMGVANDFGLHELVNKFLSIEAGGLAKVAQAALGNHVLIRQGGDEFVLITSAQDDPQNQKVYAFMQALAVHRDKVFKLDTLEGTRRIAAAEYFAKVRSAVRKLKSEFAHSQGADSESTLSFKSWLLAQAGYQSPPNDNKNAGELAVQLVTNRLAQGWDPRVSNGLLSFSFSPPIALKAACSVEDVAAALREGQFLINAVKESGQVDLSRTYQPSPKRVERFAETVERGNFQSALSAAALEKEDLASLRNLRVGTDARILVNLHRRELIRLAGIDVALTDGTLRYNLVREKQLGDFLHVPVSDQSHKATILQFDIGRFGVLNHTDYKRADRLFDEFVDCIRQKLAPGLFVRVNGGRLIYLSAQRVNRREWKLLEKKLNRFLEWKIDDARSQAEVEEKCALEQWAKSEFGTLASGKSCQIPFKRVAVRHFRRSLLAPQTFEDALREIAA